MKTFHLPIQRLCFVAMFGLSGCMTHQYGTVSSNLKQTETKEFTIENDSIKAVYSFQGENCPLQLTIFNKLDTPLYVNWKISSLVPDGLNSSDLKKESTVQGHSTGSQNNRTDSFTSSKTLRSTRITESEQINLIPPLGNIQIHAVKLTERSLKRSGKEVNVIDTASNGAIRVLKARYFTSENSPLQHKIYLTVSHQEDFKTASTLTGDFWVSTLIKTNERPSKYLAHSHQGDTFYTSKPTGFGVAMGGLIVSLSLLLAYGME